MISRNHYKFDNLNRESARENLRERRVRECFSAWQERMTICARTCETYGRFARRRTGERGEQIRSAFPVIERVSYRRQCRRNCSQSYSTSRYNVRSFSTILRPAVCDTATEYRLLILPWRFLFRPRISRFQKKKEKKKRKQEEKYVRTYIHTCGRRKRTVMRGWTSCRGKVEQREERIDWGIVGRRI